MRLITAALTFLSLTTLAVFVKANDAPKRSPELHVLDHFVGDWDVEAVIQPTDGEKVSYKVISRRSWSRSGGFIRFEDEQPTGQPEFHMLWTYDAEAKNYPAAGMNGPSSFELTGTWDEATKTMTSRVTYPDGNRLVAAHRFVTKDRAEASGKITNSDGEVVVKLSWNQTRRKAEAE